MENRIRAQVQAISLIKQLLAQQASRQADTEVEEAYSDWQQQKQY